MGEFITELRYAARALMKARGLFALALTTLALALALNSAVFAVVNAYLIRSLPYPGAERLHMLRYAPPGQNYPPGLAALDWRSLDDVLEHPISWDLDVFYLVGGDNAESAPGAWVTPGFMQGLGVRPAMGRGFAPEEFRAGAQQVALISHTLWLRRFGGDPGIVGRQFAAYVSDRPEEAELFTVIGVLPARFWHVSRYAEVFAPLRAPSYPYMARLRAGVPPEEAQRRITDLVKAGVSGLPEGWSAIVRSVHGEYVARVEPILTTVGAAALLVLLIAAANVAFLLLIRAARRQREISVRMALGATRLQIARMLLAEGLVLGVVACAAGVALSWAVVDRLAPMVQEQLGRSAPGGAAAIRVDATVLLAAGGCALLVALLFALAPLGATWRAQLAAGMQSGVRAAGEGRGSRRTRSALVAAEVAAALALLVGSGLMIQTTLRMLRVELGFQADGVHAAGIGLRERSYPDAESRAAFYERLLARLAQIPGVRAATVSWPSMLTVMQPEGVQVEGGGAGAQAAETLAGPQYFSLLGIRVLEGREFNGADRAGAEPVAIVSESLGRNLWPGRSALSRRVRMAPDPDGGAMGRAPAWRRVVGVVRDVRQSPTDEDVADLYAPLLQSPGRFATMVVRSGQPGAAVTPALRLALNEIDPEVAVHSTVALREAVEQQLDRPRFLAALLGAFAGMACVVALLGVYGVIAYAVKQREHEIAVRMALGADARNLTLLFVRQGAVALAAGVAAGLYGATLLGRLLEPQLFGLRSGDAQTLVAAGAVLLLAGLAATWWPARRAARTDPAVALREE